MSKEEEYEKYEVQASPQFLKLRKLKAEILLRLYEFEKEVHTFELSQAASVCKKKSLSSSVQDIYDSFSDLDITLLSRYERYEHD